ncbi:uncharacterized protein LOC122319494 [Drosophila yakuba]|uniref:uncharacterized protein LOC122319494 n=1 Tax=Drosophila yakuba TaxID=7245 RepID=UPI001C8A4E16|nr:uncharacterized protein LOC122319494 [Drosophila yakuba]
MGYFNAKVGPNNTGLRSVMGQHGTGTRNDNGERLVELCQQFQLVIGGTIFPHKDVHKYSWTSLSGNTRNQIDHICISRKWRHSLLDVRNKKGESIDSDHEAVKRAARNDKRALLDRLATDAERAAGENNMRSLYQQIARIAGTHQPVRDLESNLLSNDDAEIRRWRQHFMGISHTTSPNVATDYRSIAPPSGNTRIPSAPPHVREIVNAIKKLKRNRAPGGDNFQPNCFKLTLS